MALHDIDKTTNNRGTPEPNSNDQVLNRMAHGTTQNQNSIEESTADGLKFLERQIIARQGGFNKAAFGFYGDANKFGLKVAEDGIDVLTATDSQLVFNSEQNVFKVIDSDTVTLTPSNTGSPNYTVSSGEYTVSVPHTAGIIPGVIAYFKAPESRVTGTGKTIFSSNYQSLPYSVQDSATSNFGWLFFDVSATAVTFHFILWASANHTVEPVYSFKYYLLQETAN